MLVDSKTTSLLSRQEFQMQNTWELSRNRVLLAFISVLMPRLIARHVWEGCVCNWTLSQMFRWCLESSQLHLWTRTCLWLWSTGPNLGFPPGILLRWPFWWVGVVFFPLLLNRERDLSCVLSASVHDIHLWQFANEWHAFCLTGVVKIARAHLYYCLVLLWVISDQY